MKKVYLIATMVLLSLASCSEEDANGPGAEDLPQAMTFTASYSSEESTRATLSGTSKSFDARDAISILSTRNANKKFVTASGGKIATFTGDALSDNRFYAVYPYSTSLRLSSDNHTISGLNIPTSQWNSNWADGGKSGWDPSATLAYALASPINTLVFDNVCAILKISIPTTDNNVTITIGADQLLAGPCTLTNGVLTVDANGSNTVTVGDASYKVKGGSTVYVAIAPGRYTNFYVSVFNGSQENCKTKANISFTANVIHDLGSFTSYIHGNHDYVDLGLPSGTLWATCNVGASRPEEYGDYFAWGETEPKEYYGWSTYSWGKDTYNITKYCTKSLYGSVDGKIVLEPSDDAAQANWGGDWRMPTTDEILELNNEEYCTWTWTTQNGVKGCKVTSKSNGNSIFLPAAGDRLASSLFEVGSMGNYWSSSLDSYENFCASLLYFSSDGHDWFQGVPRDLGQSVRPVLGSSQN